MGDNGRLLILTGGTRGIGRAIALKFLSAGWSVATCYHQDEIAAQSFRRVADLFGDRLFLTRCDVTDGAAVSFFVDEAVTRFAPPVCAIHNAGFVRDSLLPNVSEEDWDAVSAVHLGGARNLAMACLPTMLRSGGGQLLFVSSIAATTGGVGQASYASAKAAEIGLARHLAREYGKQNIRCNTVLPGFHETRLSERLSSEAVQLLRSRHLLANTTSLDEMTGFLLWLADTQTISGQIFNLDSRMTGWI
jgi:3-oxoacyl-[acyl-carrier protein] reductase